MSSIQRYALITGSSRGIGRGIALKLAEISIGPVPIFIIDRCELWRRIIESGDQPAAS